MLDRKDITTIGCLIAILITPISIALNGWALVTLWKWFIVSTFNLQPLLFGQALGVTLITSFLTHQVNRDDDKRELLDVIIHSSLLAIFKSLLFLAIGWIYLRLFM